MFCDIATPDGEPFSGDPRIVLKRNLGRASEMGYNYAAPELEFFYFRDSGPSPRCSIMAAISTRPHSTWPRTTGETRSMPSSRWGS